MNDNLFSELDKYFNILVNFHSPIFYSIIITIVIFTILYTFFRHIIFPLNKKHILEKKELELKQAKLMALFAELAPDPIIRINPEGIIIHSNNAANKLVSSLKLDTKPISEIIPEFRIDTNNAIKTDAEVSFSRYINSRFYHIYFRGNSYLGIAQVYFHDISERKRFEDKLKISEKKLRKLSSHLIEVIEEERHRIARELHDGIGQNLLLLKMKLNNLDNLIKINKLNGEIENMDTMFDITIKELKNVIHDLKPKILEEMGLIPALSFLCSNVSEESGIEGKINFIGFQDRLNDKLEITVYRIIQESINNIVKHSRATHFIIQLVETNRNYRLIISDDGIGFNPHKASKNKNSYGILNIKERIENLHGTMKIESSAETGTFIIIEIPKDEFKWKRPTNR